MKKPDKKLDRFWICPGGPASPDRGNAGRTDFRRGETAAASPRPEQPGSGVSLRSLIGFLRFFANPLVLILLGPAPSRSCWAIRSAVRSSSLSSCSA